MTKAVAKKETTSALVAEASKAWGSTVSIDADDILIPRILMMQPMSHFVHDGKAAAGDLVKSKTGEKVGKDGKTVEFIPITYFKTWIISEFVDGKFKFRRQEDPSSTPLNAPMEWEAPNYKGEKAKWRRDRRQNFYVMLPSDIDKEKMMIEATAKGEVPDPDNVLLPCLLSFKRTSYGAGQVLTTHFAKCAQMGFNPAVKSFNLSTTKVKNDKGTFSILTVESGQRSDPYHIEAAKKWASFIESRKDHIKIDEEVEDLETAHIDADVERFMA